MGILCEKFMGLYKFICGYVFTARVRLVLAKWEVYAQLPARIHWGWERAISWGLKGIMLLTLALAPRLTHDSHTNVPLTGHDKWNPKIPSVYGLGHGRQGFPPAGAI